MYASRRLLARDGPGWMGVVLLALAVGGCASMATARLSTGISRGILDQDDPATVRAGAPAYLLMLDGFIAEEPEDRELLLAGSRLYGAYASAFVDEAERALRLSARARDYAARALCLEVAALCGATGMEHRRLTEALAGTGRRALPALYALGAAWAGWIQAQPGQWQALADLPKVEAVMERVVSLDEAYEGGRAHLYLGVMRSQLPAALGGKPERARAHFERAIVLSGGRDLMAKVLYARHYARLVYDRALHDGLLQEVLAANPAARGLGLSNALAREEARRLLDGADGYF